MLRGSEHFLSWDAETFLRFPFIYLCFNLVNPSLLSCANDASKERGLCALSREEGLQVESPNRGTPPAHLEMLFPGPRVGDSGVYFEKEDGFLTCSLMKLPHLQHTFTDFRTLRETELKFGEGPGPTTPTQKQVSQRNSQGPGQAGLVGRPPFASGAVLSLSHLHHHLVPGLCPRCVSTCRTLSLQP